MSADSRRLLIFLGLALIVSISGHWALVDLRLLVDTASISNIQEIIQGFAAPDFCADFLRRVFVLVLESIAIGALGILLALILGLPLAVLSAKLPTLDENITQQAPSQYLFTFIRFCCRGLMIVLRCVPEIIWAFLFVRVFGLGPGPAVLAIGLSFSGIIAKLYSELLEACDPVPIQNLSAAGVSRLGVLLRGALPQVKRQWVAYGLFRFECAIRSASILGVVGAGGIGAEIDLSIRYFEFGKLATALLAVLACIILLEFCSHLLRKHAAKWSLAALAAASGASLLVLDIPFLALWTKNASAQGLNFLLGFAAPSTDSAVWTKAISLMGETLAMAVFGSGVATVLALFLAPLATYALMLSGFLPDAPKGRGLGKQLRRLCFLLARLVLQLSRALPELVWALIFVVWVGPGPFAGALAICAHSIGVLGRLFYETFDEVEASAVASLESMGTGILGRMAYGAIPQAASRMLAFAAFRFEVNLRATAMMGFVGAGGIGNAIHTAISFFQFGDLAVYLLILIGTVAIIELVFDRIRWRISQNKNTGVGLPFGGHSRLVKL